MFHKFIPRTLMAKCNITIFLQYSNLWEGHMDNCKLNKVYSHCKEMMWNAERNNKSTKYHNPIFSISFRNGQVQLSRERDHPPFLVKLISGGPRISYYKNIWGFIIHYLLVPHLVERSIIRSIEDGPHIILNCTRRITIS